MSCLVRLIIIAVWQWIKIKQKKILKKDKTFLIFIDDFNLKHNKNLYFYISSTFQCVSKSMLTNIKKTCCHIFYRLIMLCKFLPSYKSLWIFLMFNSLKWKLMPWSLLCSSLTFKNNCVESKQNQNFNILTSFLLPH